MGPVHHRYRTRRWWSANSPNADASPDAIGDERRVRKSRSARGAKPPAPAARSWRSAAAGTPIVVAVATALTAAIAYYAVVNGETFPYLRNKVTPFGFLRPNEIILGERDVVWPPGTSWVLTVLFALSFVAFVDHVLRARRLLWERERRAGRFHPIRIVVVFFLLQLVYCVATWRFSFDRHLLILLPPAIVLWCVAADRLARRAGVRVPTQAGTIAFGVLLAPLVFYSVAATHDLHAISRTAFLAGEDLLRAGVDPHRIDAGYAFDGWYVYERQAAWPKRARPHDGWWVRSLFPVIQTDYVVSLSPALDRARLTRDIAGPDRSFLVAPDLRGYEVEKTYPYRTFWPFEEKTLYVLRGAGAR